MRREILRTIALGVFSLVVALTIMPGVVSEAQAQDAQTPYPTMAPIDQYLMERKPRRRWHGALLRNLSHRMPRSWSSGNMVTRPRSKARTVSYVSWNDHGPREPTIPIFGIPKLRAPICFNPPASRSQVPITLKKTD